MIPLKSHFQKKYKNLSLKVLSLLLFLQTVVLGGSFFLFKKVTNSTANLIAEATLKDSSHILPDHLEKIKNNVFDLKGVGYISDNGSKSFSGDLFQSREGVVKSSIFSHLIVIKPNDSEHTFFFSFSLKNFLLFSTLMTLCFLGALFILRAFYFEHSKQIQNEVINPLAKLIIGVKKFSINRRTTFLKVDSGIQEICELKDSFSHLILQLNFSKMQLSHANKDLESKIQDKTMELTLALEQMKKYQKKIVAQEKLASLGGLSSGIAHELRNPINLIMNSAIIVKEEVDFLFKKNQKPRELSIIKFCGIIEKNCQKADRIIQAMSFHSTVNRKNSETFNLSVCLREALRFTQRTFHCIHPNFNIVIEDLMDEDIVYCGHRDDLKKSFSNIIENSFFSLTEIFKNHNEFNGKIRIHLKKMNGSLELTVWDNGPGISSQNIERVKEPFFTTRQAGMGTGLGLTQVNDIIQSLGGELNINSIEGQFTLVQILVDDGLTDTVKKVS